jgi:hypothetical protein
MKNSIFLLLLVFIAGCKLATRLSMEKINNNSVVSYDLFYNNRTAKHKAFYINVSVGSINRESAHRSLYSFFLNSNKVEKFENRGLKTGKKYILVLDSAITYKNNVLFNNELRPVGENLFSVSQFEFNLFKKVIYFSDSLHLKDFNFLKQAKVFKLIPKN